MSFPDLFVNTPKPYANLYVNSITEQNPAPPATFQMTYLVQAATAQLPQSFNTTPVTLTCTLNKIGDFYMVGIPPWRSLSGSQRLGIFIGDLSNSPIAGSNFKGTGFSFLARDSGGAISQCGYAYDSTTNRLYVFNAQSSGGFATGSMDIAGANIPIRK